MLQRRAAFAKTVALLSLLEDALTAEALEVVDLGVQPGFLVEG